MYSLETIRPQFPDGGKPKRKKQNDVNVTKDDSELLEHKMNEYIYNVYGNKIDHNYDIPYIDSLEIKVPDVGRTTTNALDSIAKYTYEAGIPLYEGLGLAAQETAFGATPAYNYGKVPDFAKDMEDYDRALGNASYFRNYETIPANSIVRDWEYFKQPDKKRVGPPLLHAFNYWKSGKYNPKDTTHTRTVRNKGKKVINTPVIQEWIRGSKYAQRALRYKQK